MTKNPETHTLLAIAGIQLLLHAAQACCQGVRGSVDQRGSVDSIRNNHKLILMAPIRILLVSLHFNGFPMEIDNFMFWRHPQINVFNMFCEFSKIKSCSILVFYAALDWKSTDLFKKQYFPWAKMILSWTKVQKCGGVTPPPTVFQQV